jgi:transcriptional regulator with XRE-family HTH domain
MVSCSPSAFGLLLRRLRRSAGLTQAELAERCRLRRESIGILEREGRAPRRATVAALTAALGLEGSVRAQFAAAARSGAWGRAFAPLDDAGDWRATG